MGIKQIVIEIAHLPPAGRPSGRSKIDRLIYGRLNSSRAIIVYYDYENLINRCHDNINNNDGDGVLCIYQSLVFVENTLQSCHFSCTESYCLVYCDLTM